MYIHIHTLIYTTTYTHTHTEKRKERTHARGRYATIFGDGEACGGARWLVGGDWRRCGGSRGVDRRSQPRGLDQGVVEAGSLLVGAAQGAWGTAWRGVYAMGICRGLLCCGHRRGFLRSNGGRLGYSGVTGQGRKGWKL